MCNQWIFTQVLIDMIHIIGVCIKLWTDFGKLWSLCSSFVYMLVFSSFVCSFYASVVSSTCLSHVWNVFDDNIIIIFRGFKRCANAKNFISIVCWYIFFFHSLLSTESFSFCLCYFRVRVQLRQKQEGYFGVPWTRVRKSSIQDLVMHLMFHSLFFLLA